MKAFTKEHPECQADEIFIGNCTLEDAAGIGYKSKRAGDIAYTIDDRIVIQSEFNRIRPYFVKEAEYLEWINLPENRQFILHRHE